MSRQSLDLQSLAASLDRRRKAEDLSWRQLAQQLDLSPSTLTRLRNQKAPDTTALLALTRWLGMTLEDFTPHEPVGTAEEPDLVAQLVPLLRARSDLDANDIEMLEAIIEAAYRQIQSTKASD